MRGPEGDVGGDSGNERGRKVRQWATEEDGGGVEGSRGSLARQGETRRKVKDWKEYVFGENAEERLIVKFWAKKSMVISGGLADVNFRDRKSVV